MNIRMYAAGAAILGMLYLGCGSDSSQNKQDNDQNGIRENSVVERVEAQQPLEDVVVEKNDEVVAEALPEDNSDYLADLFEDARYDPSKRQEYLDAKVASMDPLPENVTMQYFDNQEDLVKYLTEERGLHKMLSALLVASGHRVSAIPTYKTEDGNMDFLTPDLYGKVANGDMDFLIAVDDSFFADASFDDSNVKDVLKHEKNHIKQYTTGELALGGWNLDVDVIGNFPRIVEHYIFEHVMEIDAYLNADVLSDDPSIRKNGWERINEHTRAIGGTMGYIDNMQKDFMEEREYTDSDVAEARKFLNGFSGIRLLTETNDLARGSSDKLRKLERAYPHLFN